MSKMAMLGLGHASTAPKRSSHERREPSGGAFTMFTPQQVKQFKEAFNMIDQDGDGRISEDDLKIMLSNLGTLLLSTMRGWKAQSADIQAKHRPRRC
jgi:myosin regulatory light chain 12